MTVNAGVENTQGIINKLVEARLISSEAPVSDFTIYPTQEGYVVGGSGSYIVPTNPIDGPPCNLFEYADGPPANSSE